MTCTREIYTRLHGEPELPTTPVEPTEQTSVGGALLGLVIALVALAGIALIVAGIAWGGPWRVAGAAATVVGIAAIVVPTLAKSKTHNGNGENE